MVAVATIFLCLTLCVATLLESVSAGYGEALRRRSWKVDDELLDLGDGVGLTKPHPSPCGFKYNPDPKIQAELKPLVEHNYAMLMNGSKPHFTKRGTSIPINFHVLYRDSRGNVPNAQLQAQIGQCNRDFGQYGFQFHINKITRTNSPAWAADQAFSSGGNPHAEDDMFRNLASRDCRVIEVYVADIQHTGHIGATRLGQECRSDPLVQGVHLDFRSLIGGGLYGSEQGKTLTHELGHALGLPHPFDNGCRGTEIRDTPPEASPAQGCPVGRRSCSRSYADDVRNYMDYSVDSCRNHFTRGQVAQMMAVAHQRGM